MKWTKRLKIRRIYYKQKKTSQRRGMNPPDYTVDQLIHWCLSNPLFRKLYKEWRQSGFDKWKAPSCDRIDDSKPYTFSNLQLMTWKENSDKVIRTRRQKKVGQFNWEGDKLLRSYSSIKNAEDATGIDHSSISKCCRGVRYKRVGGYIWKYLT